MAIRHKTVWGARELSILAFALVTILPGKAVWAQPHARIADGLKKHLTANSAEPVDVIVHGSTSELDAIAARQNLTIKKRLEEGAVFRADAAAVDSLANEAAVDSLALDARVSPFMAVTDPAIGAD